jgi:hypothetical protein
MPIQWTAEQVFGLAPDENSRRVSRRMAGPEKWLMMGHTCGTVWGELPVKNKPSIQTAVRLADPVFTCSCGNRRSPCDHAISLLLMWAEASDSFRRIELPDWARARLDDIPSFDQSNRSPSDVPYQDSH